MRSLPLLFSVTLAGIIGCADSHGMMDRPRPTPTPFPAPLACDTPDGMLGIVFGDLTDVHTRVGADSAPLVHFGLCNRTDQPVGMQNILVTETRTDRAAIDDHDLVIEIIGFTDRGGGSASLNLGSIAITDAGVLTFLIGDLGSRLMPGEFREYMLEGSSAGNDGEAEFRIGLSSGAFANVGSFSTPAGSIAEELIYNNVAIIRQVIVTR